MILGTIPKPSPPAPEPRRTLLHGTWLTDDYPYLRDRDHPATRSYIRAEQSHTAQVVASLQPLIARLAGEMRRRINLDDRSVEQYVGGYWYYARWQKEHDYPLHCRRSTSMQAAEQVYLNENELAADHDYFDLSSLAVCPRQRYVAYAADREGQERYDIRVRDIATGHELTDVLTGVDGGFAWCTSGSRLVYVRLDHLERPHSVWVHRLGRSVRDDVCLFVEDDPAFHVGVWKSRSGAFLFIESNSNTTSEVRFLAAAEPEAPPRLVRARRPDVEYAIDHQADHLLVLTNENAPNNKLMVSPLDRPDAWRTLIPERPEAVLSYVEPYRCFSIVGELHNGLDRIGILPAGRCTVRYLDCGAAVAEVSAEDLEDYGSGIVRVEVSSPVIPDETRDYEPDTGTWVLRKRLGVPGWVPDRHACERVSVPTADGVHIPLTLVHPPAARTLPGKPLVMYAYGAYGECLDIGFDPDQLSLLDRGVAVAYAHVRGGGEFGEQWHRAGSVLNKHMGIQDLLDCSEYLIGRGGATAGSIALWGGSAGGLLTAAAAGRRPHLFAAVVAEVPFVDVINALLDDSLPLTATDREEFGDPSKPVDFASLSSYSPYDNVGDRFPPLLVTAGLNDSRVGYWEPLKWTARLRARKRDDNPIVLKIDEAGHGGWTGRDRDLEDTAFIYAFLLRCWGIGVDFG